MKPRDFNCPTCSELAGYPCRALGRVGIAGSAMGSFHAARRAMVPKKVPGRRPPELRQLESLKSIDWAYASSPAAIRFGFAETGCWGVKLDAMSHSIAGFADPAEALAYARALPGAWHPMFLKFMAPQLRELFDDGNAAGTRATIA